MELETDIPIPLTTMGRPANYPFGEMAPGSSFTRPDRERGHVRSAAARYKAQHPGWDYKSLVQRGMIRLWCVKVPEPLTLKKRNGR